MKKLIMTDLVRICGSDLTSGTSDEKHECMGYDTFPIWHLSQMRKCPDNSDIHPFLHSTHVC